MGHLGYSAHTPGDVPCLIFTVNLNCEYLDECKATDWVTVNVGYTRLGNSSAIVEFEIVHDNGDKLLAKGQFTQVFVDKQTRKSTPIPEDFRASVLQAQPELVQ